MLELTHVHRQVICRQILAKKYVFKTSVATNISPPKNLHKLCSTNFTQQLLNFIALLACWG
jgi:hypothetical protein